MATFICKVNGSLKILTNFHQNLITFPTKSKSTLAKLYTTFIQARKHLKPEMEFPPRHVQTCSAL